MALADTLTRAIAAKKRALLKGGLLREVEWHRPSGPRDVRGRQAVAVSLIDALIQKRPALDRSTLDTDRADNTVLTILDPVAIKDSDTFRWGDHTYSVKAIDGIVSNEETGTRYASEVVVIR